jgi:hypothetical protein
VKCGPRIAKTSPSEEDDVEMTGDGEGLGDPSPDEDDFEKQMRLANESDKTAVRASPSQAQVDHLEGWLLEKPIPYISNDNFRQEGIFDHWNGKLPGHVHVKRTYPDVVRMWRQFHGCPGSGGGIEHRSIPPPDRAQISFVKGVFTDDEDTYRKRK